MQAHLPAHVEVIDGGTRGLDLLPYFQEKERVIIVDAVEVEDEPGAIYRLSPDDLSAHTWEVMSLHQLGLVELIANARLLGFQPEITILGIVPNDSVSCSLELTPEVEKAVPRVIQMVMKEIG
jgi:hydrogenase maturation protease